jgi:hypothetical protein
MGTIDGGLGEGLRGKFDGLSFYKMRGVDKTVVRKSGGHSKDKIKYDPDLDQFRRAGSEFGGRAVAAKFIMRALYYHKPLADYNIAGPLIALMKPVQERDLMSELGARNVYLSANAQYLKGFSLNRQHPFDSVIRYPVTGTLNREELNASVQFPELIPQVNFIPPVTLPYYSLRIGLGVVPDIVRDPKRYVPVHPDYSSICAVYADTAWLPLLQEAEAREVKIQYDLRPPDNNFTLVLTVGIRYGIVKDINQIRQAPYVGSAKVLEVG